MNRNLTQIPAVYSTVENCVDVFKGSAFITGKSNGMWHVYWIWKYFYALMGVITKLVVFRFHTALQKLAFYEHIKSAF